MHIVFLIASSSVAIKHADGWKGRVQLSLVCERAFGNRKDVKLLYGTKATYS